LSSTRARSERDTDFAALCHDLRQFVIAGRLLSEGPDPDDDELRERLDLLRANFDHAAALLDGVLSGRPAAERVDVADTAAEVVALESARHSVILAPDVGPAPAVVDPVRLRSAIGWLVRYGVLVSAGRQVIVSVGHDAGRSYVGVTCHDPGQPLVAAGDTLGLLVDAARRCEAELTLDFGSKPGTSRLVLPPA
jgi:hypothetical protein